MAFSPPNHARVQQTTPASQKRRTNSTSRRRAGPTCSLPVVPKGEGGMPPPRTSRRCGAVRWPFVPRDHGQLLFAAVADYPYIVNQVQKEKEKSGCLAWKIIKQRNQNDRRKLPLLLAGLCHLRTARRPGRLKARKPISENHISFHTTSTARQKEKKRRPASLVFRFGSVIPFSPTTSN